MGETAGGGDKRQYERKRTDLQATLLAGDDSVACDVIDISAGGGKARTAEPLDHNGALTLRIEGFGDFAGKVAWKHGNQLGLDFLDDPEKIAEVLMATLLYKSG